MNIRKTIITATVALTTVAMIAPGIASADVISDLQAQINSLMAQLQALQGLSSSTSSSVPAVCVGVTFSRNLTVGSTGADVKCMQTLMNAHGYQLATSGAGSPGNETTFFGPRTLAKVQALQAAQGWTPAGQVGPLTRGLLNSWLVSSTTTPTTPTTPVPTGAGLTVALASDNPTTGTIVDGQALASLAKLTFWNGDNAQVTVTGLKLKRIGVSADASLTNVYLFNGAVRLTDGSAVSETMINFNNTSGLFTVPSMGSVTISVLSDVNGTSGETVGMQVVSATSVTTNASSVKGTYPLTGNLMTIATGTLAGVEWNATITPSAADVDPQDGYTVFQNSVIVTTRAVDMTRISFRKTGSVSNTDLKNFKLYVDGVQIGATQQLMADSLDQSYVTFDLTGAPKRLEAGTRVVKVLADIIGGSSLNFTMHLWNVADVTVVDSQYMANILSDLISDASFTKRSTGAQTINSGTLTITKLSDSPSGDIVDAASNALLAKFEFKAAGEKVKIETLYISANVDTSGVSGLRNGAIYANGVQIGSTTTLYDPADSSFDYTTFNLGSSLIVEPGSPVTLTVRADIYDTGTSDTTNSIVSDSIIQVTIEGASTNNNGTGLVSSTTLDVPASDISANSLTVAQGTLALSLDPAYSAHSVVAPLTAYKVGDYNLVASTSEAVNISTINVAVDEVSTYATNLYVKYGTQTTSVKPTVAAANSWSINYTLAAGVTIPVEVYMDVASGMTVGTGTVVLDVDSTTVSSAVAANSADVTGQALTYTSGSLATEFASTPQNQAVSGNQAVEIGRWKFTSSYKAFTITEVKVDPDVASTATDNAEDAISSLTLWDGTTQVGTAQSFNNINTLGSTGGYYFTGLSIAVPASTSKTLIAKATLSVPSATNGTSGLRVVPALTYVEYMDDQGTVSTSTTERDGNSTYVYRSVPTLSKVELDNSSIVANGAVINLFSMKVAAPSAGDINVKQLKFDVNWSDGGTADVLELEALKFYKDGTDITASVSIVDEDSATSLEGTAVGLSELNSKIIVTWDGTTEDTISASSNTTYTLEGVPQGFRLLGATDTAADSVSIAFSPDTADVTFGSTTVDFIGYINVGTSLTGIMKLFTSATASASAEDADLIWSDNSAVAHSASTTAGTGDWTNSYLIKDNLSSETWTVQ
ncbi:MAG: hypothetical protein A3C58_02325 [Candidatus Staskawiczbacteria bacterium RIFCSPHIGHO2_02_FULL_34_10]|uniref:Peptidoglycan binding-like domain-containing protein n=2 Tax=Candidatus Staskawicziibacteriota TaxID=1817916 RepID=A0A1G2HNF7_9BACT|nr:MAG: hypothetical protein A2639_02735 [Candidatus Staskawiczbacteria bacterium RIFCSPHIGHO2_01_FULL_34_27]OGZ65872.1 MAG: hypothetical protein A3C58_02325 [Candidatus Staskawiczbacteria bacterium RIFCSPHIGHO2_02_FULL_34_10]